MAGAADDLGELPGVRAVHVAAGEVAVVELGDPSGSPAVLLAGLSDGLAPLHDAATRRMLADVPLPMTRFRGLAISYPDELPRDTTTRALAACVADVVRSQIGEPAIVVGHSLGAMVAQHLAVDAPDLVAALVLSAPTGRAGVELRTILRRWDAWLRDGQVDRFVRDAREVSVAGGDREDGGDEPASATPSPGRIERHLALSHACASHDASARVGAIRVPTLLVAGERDVVIPPQHARVLAAAIPEARLEVLPDGGHAFPEQQPVRFESLVADFLTSISQDGGGAHPSGPYAAPPTIAEGPR